MSRPTSSLTSTTTATTRPSAREKRSHAFRNRTAIIAPYQPPTRTLRPSTPRSEPARSGSDPDFFKHEETLSLCRFRIKCDITEPFNDAPPGVPIALVEHNANVIHALVLGPACTPYQCGFFHFVIHFPAEYPIKPPCVRLMNTDGGRVRFSSNQHPCGKVCLSILGTCAGPAWSPALGHQGDSEHYKSMEQHETIRMAACDTVETSLKGSSPCPALLREEMLKSFQGYYDKYEEARSLGARLVGTNIVVLMEASWNSARELQAIFRVYWFGQKKPVLVCAASFLYIAEPKQEQSDSAGQRAAIRCTGS
ncbi:hypothetical protein HPB50_012449 [Hyalomma asiaticum]|uniref:Uncharacterized protein n=1 Tax=Hyalomma asiaticum TaxID=266040 RepID=A0ACB7TGG3_HYAAI|nr:hypothetical protein HPB50_012449 [Hyalomma asiaticum]